MMSWGILVDTDSLYLEMRSRFGTQARMDYLDLPRRIGEHIGLDGFSESRALVLRHGRGWEGFAKSIEQLGYSVALTDRGVQPVSLTMTLMDICERVDGIVIVTASQRIGPILHKILYSDMKLHVASFFETMEMEGRERKIPGLILMDESWLWDGEQKFLHRQGDKEGAAASE